MVFDLAPRSGAVTHNGANASLVNELRRRASLLRPSLADRNDADEPRVTDYNSIIEYLLTHEIAVYPRGMIEGTGSLRTWCSALEQAAAQVGMRIDIQTYVQGQWVTVRRLAASVTRRRCDTK